MRTRTRVAALISTAALVATACGGGSTLDAQADPQAAVSAAFANMGDWAGMSLVMRVDSDVTSMVAMSEGELTPDIARTILDSNIQIKAHPGSDPADAADDQFEMVVRIGDVDGMAMRGVDGKLFMRADVRALLAMFDTSGEAAAQLDGFVSQAAGFGMDFLVPAVEGAWLQLDGYEEVANMMSGLTGQQQPDPAEAEAAGEAVLASIQAFIDNDVTTTFVGAEDAGDHVRITATGADALDLLEEMVAVAGPLMGDTGGVDPSFAIDELRREAGADAARLTIPLEVWIDGDTVSRVGFDLVAFAELNADVWEEAGDKPEGLEKFAVVVDLSEFGGGVTAPSDPEVVNLMQIFGALMGGLGGQPAAA